MQLPTYHILPVLVDNGSSTLVLISCIYENYNNYYVKHGTRPFIVSYLVLIIIASYSLIGTLILHMPLAAQHSWASSVIKKITNRLGLSSYSIFTLLKETSWPESRESEKNKQTNKQKPVITIVSGTKAMMDSRLAYRKSRIIPISYTSPTESKIIISFVRNSRPTCFVINAHKFRVFIFRV